MTKNIFYHLPTLGDYETRFVTTYEKVCNSRLIDEIDKFFVVTNATLTSFLDFPKIKIVKIEEQPLCERPTLMFLRDFAKNFRGYSLYLHCKGSSRPNDRHIQDWINMLEYFCIERFQDCLNSLDDGYTVAGSNFVKDADEPHFSGNFWWANNSYLSTLPKLLTEDRIRCEMWIGKGKGMKVKNFHTSNVNNYFEPYPRETYATILKI